ncbi:MAG: dTDP-glucose 4,6-dehydratase [Clostridia bacterium]|nr:dTDP-glucose 4,6-dehydratase [Clostridia bacterium]
MRVILITGGAGFIGSYFAKYFLRRNKNFIIVNIDKLTDKSSIENLRELEDNPRHHFVKGDIRNQELVNYILKRYRPDFIINFAAESNVDRSFIHPSLFTETNVIGTQTLLEGARYIWAKNNFRGNCFVQVSTDEVYGENTGDDYFTEESRVLPNNPYAASKAAADMISRSYFISYGMPVVITRSCNNYGPNQGLEKFIPKCITNVLQEKPIPIYGDGSSIREWIYVQDHCIAIIRALFYGKPGEIYNIGTGEEIRNIELARGILRLCGRSEDFFQQVEDRPSHDKRYGLNSYKARNNLNWSSKIRLEDGLKLTMQWYRNNREWWE